MENAELIQHCKDGDREAMELLYRRYRRRMMGIIYRYLHEDEAAEDVLHDGFILIFSRIGEVRKPERLEFWMATIFKNLCLDYLASLDVNSMLDYKIEIADIPELDEIIPYDELIKIINRLPKGYRDIFRMAVMENKSHKEIGKILGINPHSSSSQLFHARQLLQKMVTERKRELGLLTLLLAISTSLLFFIRHEPPLTVPEHVASVVRTEPAIQPEQYNPAILTGGIQPILTKHPVRKATSSIVDSLPEQETDTNTGLIAETIDDVSYNGQNGNDICSGNSKEETDTTAYHLSERFKLTLSDNSHVIKKSQTGRTKNSSRDRNWEFGVVYNFGGLTSVKIDEIDSNSINPPTINPPEDPEDPGNVFLGGDDTDNDNKNDKDNQETLTRSNYSRGGSNGKFGTSLSDVDNDFPLTIALSVSKHITPKVSVATGLEYTVANTSFRMLTQYGKTYRKIRTQYLGIPLKIRYEFLSVSRLSIAATGGVTADIPVKSALTDQNEESIGATTIPNPSPATQFSVSAGVGIQFNFNSHFGIYIEPSARYNLKNNSELPTYWQEHRIGFSIPLGIRATW